jgi:hypothetical protein
MGARGHESGWIRASADSGLDGESAGWAAFTRAGPERSLEKQGIRPETLEIRCTPVFETFLDRFYEI